MMPWLFLRKKCRRITLIKSVSQPRLLTSRRGSLNFTFPAQTTAFLSQSIISHRVLEAVASRILVPYKSTRRVIYHWEILTAARMSALLNWLQRTNSDNPSIYFIVSGNPARGAVASWLARSTMDRAVLIPVTAELLCCVVDVLDIRVCKYVLANQSWSKPSDGLAQSGFQLSVVKPKPE